MKAQREEFKAHVIEVRSGKESAELLIDNVLVRYGRLPDGSYFLDDYAYDWSEDLMEVARRYIDYRERAAKASESRQSRKGA